MSKYNSNYFVRVTTTFVLAAVVIVVAGLGLRLSHLVTFKEWAIFFATTCALSLAGLVSARVALTKCTREQQQTR